VKLEIPPAEKTEIGRCVLIAERTMDVSWPRLRRFFFTLVYITLSTKQATNTSLEF